MKIRFIIAISIFLFCCSDSNDKNELENWLNYYGLELNQFFHTKNERAYSNKWQHYGISENDIENLCETSSFYSGDSSYIIDLSTDGCVDEEVKLIRLSDFKVQILLYFGPGYFAETAIWKNDVQFEIMGFTSYNFPIYVPTIWKFEI